MGVLKEQLRKEIVGPLRSPAIYEKYRIGVPNEFFSMDRRDAERLHSTPTRRKLVNKTGLTALSRASQHLAYRSTVSWMYRLPTSDGLMS